MRNKLLTELFPQGLAPHSGPKPISMSSYEFFAKSDKPEMAKMRNYWNRVFRGCRLSSNTKNEILKRFKGSDTGHYSALFELFLYDLLHKLSCKVITPAYLKSGCPDFKVAVPGLSRFYLEATCLLGDLRSTEEERLHNKISEVIGGIVSNKFRVILTIRGRSRGDIKSKVLRSRVESWLRKLDYDHLLFLIGTNRNYSQLPSEVFKYENLEITLRPIPTARPLSSKQSGLVLLGPRTSVKLGRVGDQMRQKLKSKGKQCSSARLPVIVALNVLSGILNVDVILDALCGKIEVDMTERKRNNLGLWCHKGRHRNSTIAAVIIFNKLDHFLFPSDKPRIILNPFIDKNPLPLNFPYFDYFMPSEDGLELIPIWKKSIKNTEEWKREWPFAIR
jgi:hypothetical protein